MRFGRFMIYLWRHRSECQKLGKNAASEHFVRIRRHNKASGRTVMRIQRKEREMQIITLHAASLFVS